MADLAWWRTAPRQPAEGHAMIVGLVARYRRWLLHMTLAGVALAGVAVTYGVLKTTADARFLLVVPGGVALALLAITFVHLPRARRSAAEAALLARDGLLAESVITRPGSPFLPACCVVLETPQGVRLVDLIRGDVAGTPGTRLAVLHHPALRIGLLFDDAGRATLATVSRPRRA